MIVYVDPYFRQIGHDPGINLPVIILYVDLLVWNLIWV